MRRLACCGLPAVLVLTAGCATYSAKMVELKPDLVRGDYDGALALLDKSSGSKDVLLYHLERGTVLHYAGRWAESNEAFHEAEVVADALYTKSISEGALSLITSDNSISYRARPFELAMVPYFRALNYVQLGQREDAVVEGRKASQMLAKYVDATLDAIDDDGKGDLERTKDDAFLHYFSGLLYDWYGETNNAFIAYRNAAFAYQANAPLLGVAPPPSLARDLERTAGRLGFVEELEHVRGQCPAVFAAASGADGGGGDGTAEVVLLVEAGFVPQKDQTRIDVPILESESDQGADRLAVAVSGRYRTHYNAPHDVKIAYWLTLALPSLESAPAGGAEVVARAGAAEARAGAATDLGRLAAVTFDAEFGKILLKTAVRALTKYAATAKAKEAGKGFGILSNLVASVSETADTRGWLTLPRSVYVLRMSLPPGEHVLRVALDGGAVGAREVEIGPVTVRAGDWTFVSRRVY